MTHDPRSHVTDCIDLQALENESRSLLVFGAFAGILVLMIVFPLMPDIQRYNELPRPAERTIHVSLTFIPVGAIAKTGNAVIADIRPIPSPRPPEGSFAAPVPEQPVPPPEAAAVPAEDGLRYLRPYTPVFGRFPDLTGADSSGSIKRFDIAGRERMFRRLAADYGNHPETKRRSMLADIPLSERGLLRLSPVSGVVFFDLFPLKMTPPEDERRRYREDLFGLSVGRGLGLAITPGFAGVNALGLVNTGRHLVKTVIWKREDSARDRKIAAMRNRGFSDLSPPEIRFLIVLWRDGKLDISRLGRRDREFLAGDGLEKTRTFREFLDRMEQRGLAASLINGGRLLHRSTVDREEVLQSLVRRAGGTAENTPDSTVETCLRLIMACIDPANGMVRIPENTVGDFPDSAP